MNTAVLPGRVGVRELLLMLSQGVWNLMSSSYQPEFMPPMRLVLQTKLTPSAECAVTYQKTLLMFCWDVYRWRRLSKWTGIILLHQRCCSFKCRGTSRLQTLLGTHGWSQNCCTSQKTLKHTGMFLLTQNTLSFEPTVWRRDLYTTR